MIGKLQRCVESNDMDNIDAVLYELKERFVRGCFAIDVAVLIRNLMETWLSDKLSAGRPGFMWEYEQLYQEYGSIIHLLDIIRDELEDIISKEHILDTTNTTMIQISDYTDANFRTQITGTELAHHFYINQCYLSILFRKETGKTFTEYLTNKRIEYACKLLCSTNIGIANVSEKSGFKNYYYFAKVFRKIKKCI